MTSDSSARRTMVAHLVWEVLLLVAAGAVLFIVYGKLSSAASPISLLLTQLALLGLPASAIALSLRTATPNLAVGAIAGGAALLTARLAVHGWSFWPAAAVAVGAALAVGVVGALLVGLFDVPGWAVSFALIAGLTAAILAASSSGLTVVADHGLPSGKTFFNILAAVFIIASIGGGLLWLSGGLRRVVGGDRAPGERLPLGARLLGALVGFGGSAVVAAVAGVATLVYLRASTPGTGLALPLVPLGAALLGGASVYGRRGGIAGTVLASALLVGVTQLLLLHDASTWITYVATAAAITVGLGVSALFRVIEDGLGSADSTGYPATGQPYPSGPSGYAPGYQAGGAYTPFGQQATLTDRESTDALPTLEQ